MPFFIKLNFRTKYELSEQYVFLRACEINKRDSDWTLTV